MLYYRFAFALQSGTAAAMAASHEGVASKLAEEAESTASLQRPAEDGGAFSTALHQFREVSTNACPPALCFEGF